MLCVNVHFVEQSLFIVEQKCFAITQMLVRLNLLRLWKWLMVLSYDCDHSSLWQHGCSVLSGSSMCCYFQK